MDEQREFWSGEFGNDYTTRNNSTELVGSNIALFSKTFRSLPNNPSSILEVGANRGLNIIALSHLFPKCDFSAIEINPTAFDELIKLDVDGINSSFQDFESEKQYEVILFKGVLIHMNPDSLNDVYRKVAKLSQKYVLFIEYFNPTPVEVNYRGHAGKLFKRDFAGEFLDLNHHWRLLDYGFTYNRGIFSQDNLTWFLMEKPEK
jgi:spore coat polysaccharide biosynthesis protein SpsF